MLLDPGVRRRRAFVPDVQRRADEHELVGLAARSAAQPVFVPVDPDVPPLIRGERQPQSLPGALHPVGGAAGPEGQVRQAARAKPRQRGGVETRFRPNGPVGGGVEVKKGGTGGGGEGNGAGGGERRGVGGVGGGCEGGGGDADGPVGGVSGGGGLGRSGASGGDESDCVQRVGARRIFG